jgi:hypothetical protein
VPKSNIIQDKHNKIIYKLYGLCETRIVVRNPCRTGSTPRCRFHSLLCRRNVNQLVPPAIYATESRSSPLDR